MPGLTSNRQGRLELAAAPARPWRQLGLLLPAQAGAPPDCNPRSPPPPPPHPHPTPCPRRGVCVGPWRVRPARAGRPHRIVQAASPEGPSPSVSWGRVGVLCTRAEWALHCMLALPSTCLHTCLHANPFLLPPRQSMGRQAVEGCLTLYPVSSPPLVHPTGQGVGGPPCGGGHLRRHAHDGGDRRGAVLHLGARRLWQVSCLLWAGLGWGGRKVWQRRSGRSRGGCARARGVSSCHPCRATRSPTLPCPPAGWAPACRRTASPLWSSSCRAAPSGGA